MSVDTQPAVLDAGGGIDPYAEFRVEQRHEIKALLQQLLDGAVPVALSGPQAVGVSSMLWAVDGARQRVTFCVESQTPQLLRLIETAEATGVAYLDAVKLQFDLHHLLQVRGTKACVLQADMPSELYRFQRRRGFRVRTFVRSSPTAYLQHPLAPGMQLELRMLDVSIGGCALLLPPDAPTLVAGLEIRGARIELDAEMHFDTDLMLRHVKAIQTAARGARLGCEFMRLAPPTERELQRYIDRTQKSARLLRLR